MRTRAFRDRGPLAHALEARRLLSLWTIDGTPGDDLISVWRGTDFFGLDTIYASVNGAIQSRWASDVSLMQIAADHGNDTIFTSDITRGSNGNRWLYVLGGPGNDRIEIGGNDTNLHQSRTWVDGQQGIDTLTYRDETGVVAYDVTPYLLTQERLLREDAYNGSGVGWIDPGERYHYNIEAFVIHGQINTEDRSNAGNRFAINGLPAGTGVTVFGGNGRDELEIGSSTGRATQLGVNVFFAGGAAGTDVLNYRDQNSPITSTYENTGTRIAATDGASSSTVNFSGVDVTNVFGGTNRDFFLFLDPINGNPVGRVVMHGGAGNDIAFAGGITGDFVTGVPGSLGWGTFIGGPGSDSFEIYDAILGQRNYYFASPDAAYGQFFTAGGPLNEWDIGSVEEIRIQGARFGATWEGRVAGRVSVVGGEGMDLFTVNSGEGSNIATLNGGAGDDHFLIDYLSAPRTSFNGFNLIGGPGLDVAQLDDRPGPSEWIQTNASLTEIGPYANAYTMIDGVLTATTTFFSNTTIFFPLSSTTSFFDACTRTLALDTGSIESFTLREAPNLDWPSNIVMDHDRMGVRTVFDLGPGDDSVTLVSDNNGGFFGLFPIPDVHVLGGAGNDSLTMSHSGVTVADTHRIEAGSLRRVGYSEVFHDAESLLFQAGSGPSYLDVVPDNLTAHIVAGGGADVIHIDIPLGESVHNIAFSGDASDQLRLVDAFNSMAEPNSFFISGVSITLGARLGVSASGFGSVLIETYDGYDAFEIEDPAWPLTLRTGDGANDVSVSALWASIPVRVEFGSGTGTAVATGYGQIELLAPASLFAIQASGEGRVRLHDSPASVTRTSLFLADGNGRIDIGRGAVVVDYTGASSLASIVQDLQSARAGGAWTGPGIGTSAATSGSIGFAEASAILGVGGGLFAGVPVDGSAVLLRHTLPGDTNLDRQVAFNDLLAMSQNYGASGRGWWQGNFDYDAAGAVAFADLLLLSQNYGASSMTSGTRSRSRRAFSELII